jgi:hypothetical protein
VVQEIDLGINHEPAAYGLSVPSPPASGERTAGKLSALENNDGVQRLVVRRARHRDSCCQDEMCNKAGVLQTENGRHQNTT